jgi:cation diffusion facilitator family transporter
MITNILLVAIKIFIGTIYSSKALVYDGIHSLSDLFTDFALIIGAKYWTAPPDDLHPYGHGRFETLVNILIGLILFSLGLVLAFKTLSSWETVKYIPGWPAFWAALICIIIKEYLYKWTILKGKEINSKAVIANAWHHRSDALSSIPVAIAVLTNNFFPDLVFLDSIAALIVSFMIVQAAVKIILPVLKEILEYSEGKEIEKNIYKLAEMVPEIKNIHKIRSRRTGSVVLIDMHLLFPPEMTIEKAHQHAGKFKNMIINSDNQDKKNQILNEIMDVVIHIEPDKADPPEV